MAPIGQNHAQTPSTQQSSVKKQNVGVVNGAVPTDLQDSEKWPIANKITQMFPGTITIYKE